MRKFSILSFFLLITVITAVGRTISKKKPNIIIIYADDLGYGDVSCYNKDSKITTPNIDALAKQGIQFMDAHAASTICSPSRYGILTGSYSWRTNRKSGNPKPGEQPWIDRGRTTIASMLKDNGYNTAAIGKWGLGADWNSAAKSSRKGLDISADAIDYSKPVFAGKPIGFTYEAIHLWYGTKYFKKHYPCYDEPGSAGKFDGARWFFENGMSRDGDPKFANFDMEKAQMYYIDKTVEYIDVAGGTKQNINFNLKQDAPFFIYYAPHIPHYPLVPAKQFQGKTTMGFYGDYIYELDWAVGQIIKALKRNNLLENTIVIFASDNGPEIQTYGYIKRYGHKSMAQFRGVKRDLYQGGHTTPFIVSYPGKFPVGKITNRLVSQTDILATIAQYLDIKVNNKYAEDSFSFLDELVEGVTVKQKRDFAIHHSSSGKLAIRKGDWVFINDKSGSTNKEPQWFLDNLGVKSHNEEFELFNIKKDPQQTTNLVKKYPEKVDELRKDLFKYVYEGRTVMTK